MSQRCWEQSMSRIKNKFWKSIRTRLQKVRYGRGNSTPHSVRMPCNQIHQGGIVRETTPPTWRGHGGATLENSLVCLRDWATKLGNRKPGWYNGPRLSAKSVQLTPNLKEKNKKEEYVSYRNQILGRELFQNEMLHVQDFNSILLKLGKPLWIRMKVTGNESFENQKSLTVD